MLRSSLLLPLFIGLANLNAVFSLFCRDNRTFIITVTEGQLCSEGSSSVTQGLICRQDTSGALMAVEQGNCPPQSSPVFKQDFECLDRSGRHTTSCDIGFTLSRLYCYNESNRSVSYQTASASSCPPSSSPLQGSSVLCMDPTRQVATSFTQGACLPPAIPVYTHDYQCTLQGYAKDTCSPGSQLTPLFAPSPASSSQPTFSSIPAPSPQLATRGNDQLSRTDNVSNSSGGSSNDDLPASSSSTNPTGSKNYSMNQVYCKNNQTLKITQATGEATCPAGSTQASADGIVCRDPQKQTFIGTLQEGCTGELVMGEDYLCLDEQDFPIWNDCPVGSKIVPYSSMKGPASYCKNPSNGILAPEPAQGGCPQGTDTIPSQQVVCLQAQGSLFDGLPLPRCRTGCHTIDMSDYQPVDNQGNPMTEDVNIGTRLLPTHKDSSPSSQPSASTPSNSGGSTGQQTAGQSKGGKAFCEDVSQNITVVSSPTCPSPMDILLPSSNVGCAKKEEIRLAQPVNQECPPGTRHINFLEWACVPDDLQEDGTCPFGARLSPAAAAYNGTAFCESVLGDVTMVKDAYSCQSGTQLINDLALVGCRDKVASTLVMPDAASGNCLPSSEPIDLTWWECLQNNDPNNRLPGYKCDPNDKVTKVQPLKRIMVLQQYIDTPPQSN
ncbi:MAG: hypothetical protein DHS80DRAFT_31784 [Piptocephalis tieghemiana]|nr:MAG: hypothetical protein DHS80DRAFT_31784 [Piptocephalis tieghemiana]